MCQALTLRTALGTKRHGYLHFKGEETGRQWLGGTYHTAKGNPALADSTSSSAASQCFECYCFT